jgi:phosphate acetyltransferase
MKGSLHTDELMASWCPRHRIRTQRRISHCFVMDVPGHLDPLIITDAAVNIAPTLEDDHIVQMPSIWRTRSAIRKCGGDPVGDGNGQPKVQSTVEAAALVMAIAPITGASWTASGTRQCDQPRGGRDQAYRVAGRAGQSARGRTSRRATLAKSLSFSPAPIPPARAGAVPIIVTSRRPDGAARVLSPSTGCAADARPEPGQSPRGAADRHPPA